MRCGTELCLDFRTSAPAKRGFAIFSALIALSCIFYWLVDLKWLAPSSMSLIRFFMKTSEDDDLRRDPEIDMALSILLNMTDTPYAQHVFDAFEADKLAIHHSGNEVAMDLALIRALFPNLISSPSSKKRQLRIAAIGGSVTAGHGIDLSGVFFNPLIKWFLTALAGSGVEVIAHNAATGGISSHYFAMCINEHLNLSDYDFLFIELAINDDYATHCSLDGHKPGEASPMEQLVRIVLRENPLINIILVNFPYPPWLLLQQSTECSSVQDKYYLMIAERYELTSIRWKHRICNDDGTAKLMNFQELQHLRSIYVSTGDNFHPSELVHQEMAAYIISFFRSSLRNVAQRLNVTNTKQEIERMVIGDEKLVRDRVANLLSLDQPTVFPNTVIEGADCALSIERPFRNNTRLVESLTKHSDNLGLAFKHFVANYGRGAVRVTSGEYIQYIHFPSFKSYAEFTLDHFRHRSPCHYLSGDGHRGGYFLPRIVLNYKICQNCRQQNLVKISASFILLDNSEVDAPQFTETLQAGGCHIHASHFYPPIRLPSSANDTTTPNGAQIIRSNNMTDGCWDERSKSITSAVIRVELESQAADFILHGVVVAYQCCK